MCIYFIPWIIIQDHVIYFLAHIVLASAIWRASRLASVSPGLLPPFFVVVR